MKLLVTGGAGFIGSHFVEQALEAGHAITVVDALTETVHGGAETPGNLAHVADSLEFLRGDVGDATLLGPALDGCDAVVHLAAERGNGRSMYEPARFVRANCVATAGLLEAIAARPTLPGRLVVASSLRVCGEGAVRCESCGSDRAAPRTAERIASGRWEVPCARCGADTRPVATTEEQPVTPSSIDAATKLAQEQMCLAFGEARGMPVLAVRLSSVLGARQSPDNPFAGVAAGFTTRLRAGEAPRIFEDGAQTRDFVDVRDAARALLLAVESASEGCHAVNIGSGRGCSIGALARKIAALLGSNLEPDRTLRYRAGDVRHLVADLSRAEALLGYVPQLGVDDALEELVRWSASQPAHDRSDEAFAALERHQLVR